MSADLKESTAPLAEISQGPNAFELFLDRHQKGIVVFAILLALGAAAAVVYRGVENSHQETAGAALSKAESLTDLEKVVTDNADTIAAGSAMVLLADSQWLAGKQDDGIATLRKFIATYPKHPALATAKASLGSKLMVQGKTGDATKVFDDLAADPDARFIAPFALISLGDMAKSAGDLAKAEGYYNKAKEAFPDSSFSETANRSLGILKAKLPAEIEPPPTPSAAATPPEDPTAAIRAALPPGISVTPVPQPTPTPTPTPPPAPKP